MSTSAKYQIYKKGIILSSPRNYAPHLGAMAMADRDLYPLLPLMDSDPEQFIDEVNALIARKEFVTRERVKNQAQATTVMNKAKAELNSLTTKVSVIESLDLD